MKAKNRALSHWGNLTVLSVTVPKASGAAASKKSSARMSGMIVEEKLLEHLENRQTSRRLASNQEEKSKEGMKLI